LPALVVCVGLISLVYDSWLSPLPHRGNMHALFGILLWLCVVERFYARFNVAPRMSISDIRPLSRHLSRLVYLLLYGLMLVRLIIDWCAAPHHASLHAPGDFQSYLVCGVLALITIHLLAAWCRHLVVSAADTPLSRLHGNGLQRNGRLT
jgi:cytochrome b561